jgi:hypothetical protein
MREAEYEYCRNPPPLTKPFVFRKRAEGAAAQEESSDEEEEPVLLDPDGDEGMVAGADERHSDSTNLRIYTVNGEAVEVNDAEHYKYRGEELKDMNLIVYFSTIASNRIENPRERTRTKTVTPMTTTTTTTTTATVTTMTTTTTTTTATATATTTTKRQKRTST